MMKKIKLLIVLVGLFVSLLSTVNIHAADYNVSTGQISGAYGTNYSIQVSVNNSPVYLTGALEGESSFSINIGTGLSANNISVLLFNMADGTSSPDVVNVVGQVTCQQQTQQIPIPFQNENRNNPDLLQGVTRIVRDGKNGLENVVKNVCSDGSESIISRTTVTDPVSQITEIGTKVPSVKIEEKAVTEIETIPFSTVYEDDSSLEIGREEIKSAGQQGQRRVTYIQIYENGVLKSTVRGSEELIKEPVNQVVIRGTKEVDTKDDEQSSAFLSSLEVIGGTLTPSFSSRTKKYTIKLDENVQELEFSGEAQSPDSEVKGFGKVKSSEKKHIIEVTSKDGSKETYEFTWDSGKVLFTFDNKPLTYDPNKSNIYEDFSEKEIEIEGEKFKVYSDKDGHLIIGLTNENGQSDLYLYSKDKGVLGKFDPIMVGNKMYNKVSTKEIDPALLSKFNLEKETNPLLAAQSYKVKDQNKSIVVFQDLNGETGVYEFNHETGEAILIEKGNVITESVLEKYFNVKQEGSGGLDLIMVGLLGGLAVALAGLIFVIVKQRKERETEEISENNSFNE